MKELIDYIPKEQTERLMDLFSKARKHSEPIYSDSERYFRQLMKVIGEKESIDGNLLTCMKRDELESYFKNGNMPKLEVLKDRFNYSVVLYKDDTEYILTGQNAENIDTVITESNITNVDHIKGTTGYKGLVKGICRIIVDPYKYEIFNEGDILVTGMTRPEFIPLMKKAAAFVTDAGGMLCHAAISAREMKKPCIVGTEIATKVIKNGQIIEVDANNGIVKVI